MRLPFFCAPEYKGESMSLISNFKINGLNKNYNVNLFFKNDKTIFIGENGVGKTTILSILYYVLDLNFEELLRFNFDSLELTFEKSDSLRITKQDMRRELKRINRRKDIRRSLRFKWEMDDIIKTIEDDPKLTKEIIKAIVSQDNDSNSFREVMDILKNNKEFKIAPLRFKEEIFEEIDHRFNPSSYRLLIDKIINIKESYKILYFPTYRRIEENLAQLDMKSKDERLRKQSNGELIHFGMEDVKQKIEDLLNRISKETNESYNLMTSGLLNTFAEGKIQISSEEFDIESVDIALSRLGNKITPEAKATILDKIRNNNLKDDQYLNYLISSIVKNNESLKEFDSRINTFKDNVNKYLFNKKFFYDAESLKLEIKRTDSDEKIKTYKDHLGEDQEEVIDLGCLSSGEKQLVSAFSKIFLEDEKDMIVLFDEPELSLSVPWQMEFIYDISQASQCKFLLVVTHSPFIYEKLFQYAKDIENCITESSEKDEFSQDLEDREDWGDWGDWGDSFFDDELPF